MTEAAVHADDAFRADVRRWLAANLRPITPAVEPEPTAGAPLQLVLRMGWQHPRRDDQRVAAAKAVQARLFDGGYAGITWPVRYGGRGLTLREQAIFDDEAVGYHLPGGTLTFTLGVCGPTLLAHGSDAQKERFLPPMVRGEEVWCVALSEPDAGSDLAALTTAAERDGDEWILTGHKTWVSGAHFSEFAVVAARTDPDARHGIAAFIVDLRSPGITITALRQITGGSNFNDVYFDGVRLPADSVVGDPAHGWRAVTTVFMNGRLAVGTGGRGAARPGADFPSLLQLARVRGVVRDRDARVRLADLYIRQSVLGFVADAIRDRAAPGREPSPDASIAKVLSSRLARQAAGLAAHLAGPAAVAWPASKPTDDRYAVALVAAAAQSIGGGTDEVQLNAIAERILGLPHGIPPSTVSTEPVV